MPAPADHVAPEILRDSFVRHAARAQLYRFLDYAARPVEAAAALIDLAADTAASAALKRDGPVLTPGLTDATFDVKPDRVTCRSPTLHAALRRDDTFLPRIVEAVIEGQSGVPSGTAHRVSSAVHYFFALVENPARDPAPFGELLAKRFSLGYTAEPLTDLAAVSNWVTGRLASVVASEHAIHRLAVMDLGGDRYQAEVAMKSQALFPDGSGAISRNTQRWTLTDEPARDRFPRIAEILIDRDAVEFFGPAPDFAPRPPPG